MTPAPRETSALLLIVAAPLLMVFAAGVFIIAGWAIGRTPFWPTPDLNLSEYAALIDTADVVRLIRDGADPNRPYHVPDEYLRDWYNKYYDEAFRNRGLPLYAPDGMYRPLRVAAIVRQPGLVRTLIREGATLPRDERTAVICFTNALRETAIADTLIATGDGSDPRASCPPPVVEP